jgi:hypothetical protein
MQNFIISLIASLLAAIIVLLIERMRLPNLVIIDDNKANTTPTYGQEYGENRGKWKFIRVSVLNKQMPFFLKWLTRQTAENCRAMISFFNDAGEAIFTMKGRWADTPELAFLPPNEGIIKILYPEPVSISVGDRQVLDVVAMKEGEREAFGWNNEAYFNHWKTQKYRLSKGEYNVKIDISTQNGISFTKTVKLEIGEDISSSFFRQS